VRARPGADEHPTAASGTPTFGEYLEHAVRSREYEEQQHAAGGGTVRAGFSGIIPDGGMGNGMGEKPTEKANFKNVVAVEALTPDEQERLNARRALRSASWAAVFYLITTDILGREWRYSRRSSRRVLSSHRSL
jgi:hypothetical protein